MAAGRCFESASYVGVLHTRFVAVSQKQGVRTPGQYRHDHGRLRRYRKRQNTVGRHHHVDEVGGLWVAPKGKALSVSAF